MKGNMESKFPFHFLGILDYNGFNIYKRGDKE